NRLNMIHEGTHGIQALDLLGRKVLLEGGKGLKLLSARIDATRGRAVVSAITERARQAEALEQAWSEVLRATEAAWATGLPAEALANAVPYMQAFGHTVLAWIWLDVALASDAAVATKSGAAHAGFSGATAYFYAYELPKIVAWLKVVESRDQTCAKFPEEAF
ncbi:MAG: acyl-CoA dehydrogenase, partial [Polaromonas sp.]|nr:acyl-CoA dehydrogenase [Polaromonas sp.]